MSAIALMRILPKLSDCWGCRSREMGFAFHRAGSYKEDVVPL